MSNKYYSLRSYLSYLSRHKLKLAVVFFGFLLANLLLAIIPVFIGKLIGALADSPVNRSEVSTYIVILIACSSGHDILWRLSEFLYMKLMHPLLFAYENILFQTVIRKPYPYFVDKFTGKIGSYISLIGDDFRELTSNIYWDYAGSFISLGAVAIILTTVKWETGISFIVGIVLMFVVGRFTIKNSTKYERAAADVQSTKNGKIIDAIGNFVNVKSFHKETTETNRAKDQQSKSLHAANRAFAWGMFFWGSMSFFVRHLIWPITILINVGLFLDGKITLAELITFMSAILIFSSFIWEIIWNVSQFNLKVSKIEEAHLYLFGKTNIVKEFYRDGLPPIKHHDLKASLSLVGLTFAYPDQKDTNILTNLNITIKKGERVGIVGKSGSGKTTLTKILLGYYPVSESHVLIDGQPTDTKSLSRLISYVPQDTSLFHRTIADNIAYAADKPVTRHDVIQAAKQAHADEFISKIPGDYDALVGERGVKLSTGQRQRIAIARAMLDNQPILILDEATSALDSESEALVQKGLEALWQGKTVIAIAHRLSTLNHMDKIIVMDKGQIVESGTHPELLKQNGMYAKLWAHQSGGFLEE